MHAHMQTTCTAHTGHTAEDHSKETLLCVCVYICAVLKGSVIRGVLTLSPVNVIKVVEGVLHDAVAYLTEISGNSKKGMEQ